MTKNGNFKRRVRARAAKTGESYSSALMQVRRSGQDKTDPPGKTVRLAVAQTTVCDDPRDIDAIRAAGLEIRQIIKEAHDVNARLVQFPEGAICAPNKRLMSAEGPGKVGPSDWGRYDWNIMSRELQEIRILAKDLGLWIVLGSAHQLTHPRRPYNSLYVISDQGKLVTRYDERMLSNTKISFMYSPGSAPVTFAIDGVRFGCTLGMEAHYPEIFIEYEQRDVDCVLFSTTGASPAFASEMVGHAASNDYWTSYSVDADPRLSSPSGIATPGGQWAARASSDGVPGIAVADITNNPGSLARPWRRTARGGLYEPHLVDDDPRSDCRDMF
ncbi:MAG: carbon-nitrogen hydrolase family protein [Stappiaceae bacterium]